MPWVLGSGFGEVSGLGEEVDISLTMLKRDMGMETRVL